MKTKKLVYGVGINDAALDFAKFMREGDVLVRCGMIDEEKVWQLTYNKGESY